VAKSGTRSASVVAPDAREDIRSILRWSERKFGKVVSSRYRALLKQAIRDIEVDPLRPGSYARPDLMVNGARMYFISFSRDHVAGERIREPRHLILYRIQSGMPIEIGRILHDGQDTGRHVPDAYRRILPGDAV
jgi:toxin ParE1/3/4